MIISEEQLIDEILKAKKIFLLEPDYRRKYVPLGLAKIASLAKSKGIEVTYGRKYNGEETDIVLISTVFTYFQKEVYAAIQQAKFFNKSYILGGIYATLMATPIQRDFPDAKIFKGYSKVLDSYIPDYSIDYGVEEEYQPYSYLFTTRGCPNTCAYCAVSRIEPGNWINPDWKKLIVDEKPYTMLYDNNLGDFELSHVHNVLEYLSEKKKKVQFNGGFDVKHLDDETMKLLAKIKFVHRGMRTAFDRIEEDGLFQSQVNKMLGYGVNRHQVFAYTLFNFQDKPKEADYRAWECVKLGIEPYPTMYIPLHYTNRKSDYVGKYWTKNLVRCYRRFWMLAGYYKKMRFNEFIHDKEKRKYDLTEEDFAAWEQT